MQPVLLQQADGHLLRAGCPSWVCSSCGAFSSWFLTVWAPSLGGGVVLRVRPSALVLLPEVRGLQVRWLMATSSGQAARRGSAPLAEPSLPGS